MVCLGLEPGAARWKAQTNPLSYGGTPIFNLWPAAVQLQLDVIHCTFALRKKCLTTLGISPQNGSSR